MRTARLTKRLLLIFIAVFGPAMVHAQVVDPDFDEAVVWSGFNIPTAVRFAPNGNVFVAEKSGIITMFDSVADQTPTVFADLRNEVHDYWDRGLLGLAIDPDYPAKPYVYAFYALDAPPGSEPPFYNDQCPNEQCPANSRLVRLTVTGTVMTSKSTVLESWCHDNYSHSTADLVFDADRSLFVAHGDGARFSFADYDPVPNNCGDPPLEGGAMRSQDLRTLGDPVSFAGAIIRINPDTGLPATGNPLLGGSADDDAVIAYGLRNPFRISRDSMSGRLWIGDVGWANSEEIDTIENPLAMPVRNFGWPCYEGSSRQSEYDSANLPVCEGLYSTSDAVLPYYNYGHLATGGAISGVALYRGANFPQRYHGALFFTDYTRGWINVMLPGIDGLPDPALIESFIQSGTSAVDLQVSPDGHLFYADIYSGTVRRVRHVSQNTAPTARIAADKTYGTLPLTVTFSASGSSDPDLGDTLSYAWDLDGDGLFDDSIEVTPQFVYTTATVITVRVRVTDSQGESSTASLVIDAGNTPPQASISSPTSALAYSVGEVITFSGTALDGEGNPLPPSALNWRIVIHHCAVLNPEDCHEHFLQEFDAVAGGTFVAPDHEFPVFLEVRFTARSGTLTDVKSVNLAPRTAIWTFNTEPAGLSVGVYSQALPTPYTREVVVGAQTTISVASPQTLSGTQYQFVSWSDGGAQAHGVSADAAAKTFTATFAPQPPTCTLSVTPGSVVQGSNATLSWTTTDATSLSIDQGIGAVTPVASGSSSLTPAANTTYTGTVTGTSGSASCTAAVTVTPPPPPPQPVCTLTGIPASISQGNSAALSWTTTNATALSIDQGIGAVTPVASGSTGVTPTTTTAYNGSVTGPGGTASCAATITVTPPQPPTCTLSVTPASISLGSSATLSWTTTNGTALSIDQGVGSVTPVASGSRSVNPVATLTYTGTVSGTLGNASCATTLTVTAAPAETVWRSYDAVVQGGSPQGSITSVAGGKVAALELYESTNNGGVGKNLLFGSFTTAAHADSFNKVERFWSAGGSAPYPYAGKSTVNRGTDVGESNTPLPTGVRDLQMHPPNNAHLTVAAFRVPESGNYSVSDLAVRRVDATTGYTVRARLFNAQGVLLANLQATSRAWVSSTATYNLGTLTAGQYIYFAVDGDGNYFFDATEIAWQVRLTQ